ncbi:MAG: serine/threonine-protein kinase, partial [Bradymonadaceae bacterium]
MRESVSLGAFSVSDQIGRGGMGTVYRGKHRETGLPVAIKVVRGMTDRRRARERFHREVQAHASLVHPGIVYLFEYGEVDAATAKRSGGELRAGMPYVVMELADRGTVRNAMPLQGWDGVIRLVTQVLDALAHAHARDLVHRDLKPENFLVFGSEEAESRIKLADFGLAHATGREQESGHEEPTSSAGTPYYM